MEAVNENVKERAKKRKGVRHDGEYARNVIKQSRLTGKAYINHRKKDVPARKTGSQCRYVYNVCYVRKLGMNDIIKN